MIFRNKVIACFILALLVASNVAYVYSPRANAQSTTFTQSGTLNLALPNCMDSFSQYTTTCSSPWYFLQSMFPDNGVPTAGGLFHIAVQSYSSNSNGSTWYFRVTPGMTWSDGVVANATDLAWDIQAMFVNYTWGVGSLLSYKYLLNGAPQQAVHADNASVVEVDLKQPFSLFGDIVGGENTPNFTPYHVWKNWINATTAPGSLFGKTLVGVGPYYVSNFQQGAQNVVMLPNPNPTPWGSSANGGHPYFSQVVAQLVPSSSSLADLLLSGQIDASPVAPSDVAGLLNNPNIKVTPTPGTGLWYLEFTEQNYPYNVTSFRQALAYAINTQGLVQNALAGYGTVGNAGFIPSTAPEFNSSIPTYNYNSTVAKQMFAGTGLVMGSSGFFNYPNGTAFQPNVYVPAEQTPIVLAGTLVVQNLQAAGIDAQLRPIAGASMASVWYLGTNMYFEEQNFGYPNSELLTDQSFYSFFLSAGPAAGQSAFSSPSVASAYNALVSKIESSTNQQQIVNYEKDIQGLLAENLPSIPLFYPDFIWAYNTQKIGGWPQAPGSFELPGLVWNITALAAIHPASISTTSTTSSGTSTTAMNNTLLAVIAAVIIIVIIVAVSVLFMRRKRT